MAAIYLHQHSEFSSLVNILGDEKGIIPPLIEKDYWIMHVLYGLQQLGLAFELKGGTSLSKGYGLIDRFSEDLDIHIHPPAEFGVNENPKNTSKKNIAARKVFYEWLANSIRIDGITDIQRDVAFDDLEYYRSGGIRLFYRGQTDAVDGLKDGILLEVGFDRVSPNTPITISSWAFDRAAANASLDLIANMATSVHCYHPGYTFVEKMQTIATKFRKEQMDGRGSPNFMRQYYDVYCLLGSPIVQQFMGTPEYEAHKLDRFPAADRTIPIQENEAFRLTDPHVRSEYKKRYATTAALYYKGQPDFEKVIERIQENLPKM